MKTTHLKNIIIKTTLNNLFKKQLLNEIDLIDEEIKSKDIRIKEVKICCINYANKLTKADTKIKKLEDRITQLEKEQWDMLHKIVK